MDNLDIFELDSDTKITTTIGELHRLYFIGCNEQREIDRLMFLSCEARSVWGALLL